MMLDEDLHAVLRCSHCNKPFDKHSSLKRHGYYCRSGKTGATVSRLRSCICCARSKLRCDQRRPECSRCVNKSIQCRYPPETKKEKPSTMLRNADEETLPAMSDDLDFSTFEGEILDWGIFAANLSPMPDFQGFDGDDRGLSSKFMSLPPYHTPVVDGSNYLQHANGPSTISLPRSPTTTLRLLNERPKTLTGTERIAKLMLHNLKSYSLMLLRDDTLPPFIHPSFVSTLMKDDRLEPLANCISLTHMIRSGMHGSRKLFWKNVRLECEHLCTEYLNLDAWGILAGFQALLIYIFMRLEEGETEHNNLDSLLVVTVTIMSKRFAHFDYSSHTLSTFCEERLESSWNRWLLEESLRRVSLLYQVLDMLIYFDPASLCDLDHDLILAPLPSRKQLWEAGDDLSWMMENEKDADSRDDFALDSNGDLVNLGRAQSSSGAAKLYTGLSSRRAASWEQWCAGMDGFGGLVMLAASLVGS